MSLAQPSLLWLLLVLAPLAWWLATGAKPPLRRAPSLAFWPRELPATPTPRRRRLPFHAWLALLAAALAIAALSGPSLVRERPLPLRLWLDRSASMGARGSGGATRLDEARAQLARALADEPAETPCELWCWPLAERIESGDVAAILRALERLDASRFVGAEEGPTSSELGAGRLWWVGDREPEDLPPRAAFLAVGEPLRRNAGWVSASFTAPRELWLVVACTGTERVELELRNEPGARALETLALEPGARRALRLEVDPTWSSLRLVAANGADQLPLDDELNLALDARPLAAVSRDLPAALQRAFAADERLAFGGEQPPELLIDGAFLPRSDDPRCALRFGAGAGAAAVEDLRWEDLERDALWHRLAPAAWPLRGIVEGRAIARATPSARSAIALVGAELHCALDAVELAQSSAARAELPLLCALLVDELRSLLRDAQLDRARSAPLDLGETKASVRGVARAETREGRRALEQRPFGRWLALAAALAWLAACAARGHRAL
ncbi:MAG: hypothetical protein IPN34_05290 [Planctomycetes bacterium]|nr:hypothetical protein [Planctomycetota bacterium]